MSKKFSRGLAVGTAAFLVCLALRGFHVFQTLEWNSWDLRLRLFSRPSQASRDIVLILIDQPSLDVYEKEMDLPWPWPRQMYSAVIKYLNAGGARAVFFDLILSEASRFGVEDDQDFAKAMAESGNVFIPFFLSEERKEPDENAARLLERFVLKNPGMSGKAIHSLNSVSLPVETIVRSAAGSGNVRFSQDKDSIFRRLPLLFSYDRLILPSLPLALAEFIQSPFPLRGVPLDDSGRMIIRFHGPTGSYRAYSAAAVINSWARLEDGRKPQIDPSEFAGKIVFVGTSAPGLLDLRPTPFSPVCPGTEIQAAALDNLLNKTFIRFPPRPALLFYVLVLALGTAVGVSLSKKIWKISLFFILCLALPAAASAAAFAGGYWLEFAVPEFAVVLSFIGASLLNYSLEGRQRRFIKNVFRYYLSPDVIERIIKNPSLLALGGERREISAFFSDVAGFTSLSEKLAPEELVNLLNAYLSEMTDIILSTGGTLDKYEGDAIIAFWNAPLDQPDHALRACRAALLCQKRLAEMRPDFVRDYGCEVVMRIGVHSGPAVVGNMGSRKRFDYTAMGDTMNLASRLEGACKTYALPILISEETWNKVKNEMVAREVDTIRVVGKKQPVRIFDPAGEKTGISAAEVQRIDAFHKGLEAYRKRDWDGALEHFRRLENDVLAGIYIRRCLGFKMSAPPADWDGIHELKEK